MRRNLMLFVPLLATLAACSGSKEEPSARSRMSQRQRDSVLAESNLPGSRVVRKAISMSDAQEKRAAMMDSASQ